MNYGIDAADRLFDALTGGEVAVSGLDAGGQAARASLPAQQAARGFGQGG